jgi:lipopolysaccharide biosynthesis regulator YciM
MFDSAAQVLEEIAPEDKNRKEVLGARLGLYMAANKWDMAAAVASHLVKVELENGRARFFRTMDSLSPG